LYKIKNNHALKFKLCKLFNFKLAILLIYFFGIAQSYAHEKNQVDLKDSLKFYKRVKKIAYKNKLSSLVYDAIFQNPEPKEYPTNPASKETKQVNPYLHYKGCIIKNIKITVYDPFGYNTNDTIKYTINKAQRFGNNAHITTRQFVIINKLLFKKNDSINPLSISESERILREAVFVTDANIYISATTNKDSVNVNVIIHDKWPITIPLAITDIYTSARFRNLNLFGVGQQFEQYGKLSKPNDFEFNGYYGIANIDNTYISSNLAYFNNKDGTDITLSFDRPFFSPLTPWAGGITIAHSWRKYQYTDSALKDIKLIPINSLSYDLWTGKSLKLFKLKKDKSFFNQSTNIIIGGRYYARKFLNKPSELIDPSKTNFNTDAGLGNIAFSVQQFYKDKFIYRFGANEDVPEGLIVQFIYGVIKQEYKKIRYYTGIEIARAKHFKIGYFSATFSYGIFFNKLTTNDITTNYKLYYFSNLYKKGKWFFREFLNLNFVHGQNKLNGETITFSNNELYGFENRTLTGNTKITLSSETVAYLPYQLIGFRFAPVITIGLGIIGNQTQKLISSNLYQAYTLGVMLRNENLLTSTFQFSVGAYPFFPDDGKFTLKYNPIASFTLRVRAFSVSKPEFISY